MSRQTRSFFYYNDRLNKGYDSKNISPEIDLNLLREKFKSSLPPIEVISMYEELYPGILEKVITMAEREQNHKHAVEKISITAHEKARFLGQVFGLFTILSICYVTLTLVKLGKFDKAIIFGCVSFGSIFFISIILTLKAIAKSRSLLD